MRAHRFGVALAEGILAFAREDYSEAVDLINPVRYDIRDLCGASHAQRVSRCEVLGLTPFNETQLSQDIIDLLLLVAAIRAGRKNLATGLIGEAVSYPPTSGLLSTCACCR